MADRTSSVTSYATASATLCLQDPHPRGSKDHVLVDVKLLLETLKTENTQIGEWVNVIGYIVASPVRPDTTPANRKRSEVHIQALLLWSAGPLDLDRYEASLEALDDEDEAPNG